MAEVFNYAKRIKLETSEHEMGRNFGYAQIVWEIEGYFFATCKKEWVVYSPEFSITGYHSTKWRLFLRSAKVDELGGCATSICLERLGHDTFDGPVRVFWNMWYPRGTRNIIICRKEIVFERTGKISERMKNFKRLEGRLQLVSSDKLRVEGLILIRSPYDDTISMRSKDSGLRSLSQDLGVLDKFGYYGDMSVLIGINPVICHKAIVCSRNKLLKDAIKSNRRVDLGGSEMKYVNQIVRYLYTGNLDYVLRMPSILMDQTISHFGIKELEVLYMKDELTLFTKYEARETSFKWFIAGIHFKSERFLLSPPFCEGNLNFTFRLRIQPNDKTEYMGIFIEIIEGFEPEELYVKFDILDEFDHSLNLKAMRWPSEESEELGIRDFTSRDILDSPYFANNGKLCVTCTFYIPTGSPLSEVVSRICSINVNCEEHYDLLSTQIQSLFETGKYSDFTIECGKERFKVHKCILTVRSSEFSEIIKGGEKKYRISYVDPNILRIILNYIYSGKLKNYELCDLMKIYLAAKELRLIVLKYECSRILRENFQQLNVLEVLFLADASDDLKLMDSAFKFIVLNIGEIRKQYHIYWEKLIHEYISLFEELKVHLKNHAKNNPGGALKFDDIEVESSTHVELQSYPLAY